MKNKILFISHDASRTGAPRSLLRFMIWLKAHSDIPFHILLRKGGVLEPEFRAIAPVSILYKDIFLDTNPIHSVWEWTARSHWGRMIYFKYLKEKLLREHIGLIYANTLANGDVLEFLEDLRCPVICHVRELEYILQKCVGLEEFEKLKRYTTHYITVSEAVKENLYTTHHIPASKLDVIRNFIPLPLYAETERQPERPMLCRSLGIPEDACIVCASGTTEWRKGPDLFIQLAHAVAARNPERPVYFWWVGKVCDWGLFGKLELDYEMQHAGVENYVYFLGSQANPFIYFASCDVFAMLSREDPFPLVCLEVASLEKPILCFHGTGGAQEFVEDDAGFVLPYLDLEAMAEKVILLAQNPNLCQRLGKQAKQKIQTFYNIEYVGPTLLKRIQDFLSNKQTDNYAEIVS